MSSQEASKGALDCSWLLVSTVVRGSEGWEEVVQVGKQGQGALGHTQLMASPMDGMSSWRSPSVELAEAAMDGNPGSQ